MYGAIIGDIIGSIYEANNIKDKKFNLYSKKNTFTDDSVMTCAIMLACIRYNETKDKNIFKQDCIKYMQLLGRMYPRAGYGGTFIKWIFSINPQPYNSYGNGAAMRVSPVAWISDSLEEAEELAEISASVSHNHPEGIKGAKSVAGSVWLAKNGRSKEEIKQYINDKYYNLNFTIDEIRNKYSFDVSCQGSVPQAIKSFIEASDYEDCIRNSISLGGDSDTIAAISGSIAEAFYGIPQQILAEGLNYLDEDLLKIAKKFNNIVENKNIKGIKIK